jgi:predicted RNA-binding protein YlxR (DUF448 family)
MTGVMQCLKCLLFGRGCYLMRDVVQWLQRQHRTRLSSSFRDEDEPENLFLFDSVTWGPEPVFKVVLT